MIYCYYGENDYATKRATTLRVRDFVEAHPDAAIERIDAVDLDTAQLPSLFSGISLFSQHKVVILREPEANKAIWELLPEHIVDDELTLVILQLRSLDKRTKTYKWLQKNATLGEHKNLDDRDAVQWLQSEARSRSVTIPPETARYMVNRLGTEQWLLSSELDKLAIHGSPITEERVRQLTEPTLQANAFMTLEVALRGGGAELDEQIAALKSNEEPHRFFGLLVSQVYALVVCHAAGQRSPEIVAKEAGIHPYVATKTRSLARGFSSQDIKQVVAATESCDHAMKSSGAEPWQLIELCLKKIAAR